MASSKAGGVAAILLGAGLSRRFHPRGAEATEAPPKQLIPWNGRPLIRHAAETLLRSRARPVITVLGHRAAEIAPCLDDLDLEIIVNPRFRDGQSTSVVSGLESALAMTAAGCRGALFLPADQPLLKAATIDRLIEISGRHPKSILRPRYAERPGAPVLFPAAFFDHLRRLEGDEGGRQILKRHPESVLDIPVADDTEGLDIDTTDDLERLLVAQNAATD